MDHIIHAKPKPFGEIFQIGQHGVGTMHDPLGLTGRAAGIKKLDHLIRAGTMGGGKGRAGRGVFKQPRKTIGAITPDHKNMRELRQVFAQIGGHVSIIKTTETCRHHQYLALCQAQHEAQFAFAENHHQRITDGAELQAGKMQDREFPPIRQLK